jgi:superfamily II DNA or RNA helicase
VEATVEAARKRCSNINPAAWFSNFPKADSKVQELIIKDKINREELNLVRGGINLIVSPPNSGKTYSMLNGELVKIDGIPHKIIFAAPQNSIVDQQYKDYLEDSEKLEGLNVNIDPDIDKTIATYNALVSAINKTPELENYIVVIDECHRIITDMFRAEIMSQVVGLTNARCDITFVYMSGTFDSRYLGCIKFDREIHVSYEVPKSREVQVVEAKSNLCHAVLEIVEKSEGNCLILIDNKTDGAAIANAIGGVQLMSDNKKEENFQRVLKEERIWTHTITTQVFLEGVNLIDCVDSIIIVSKGSRWGCDQMAQYYLRERIRNPKLYFVRKPLEAKSVSIPDPATQKHQQDLAMEQMRLHGEALMFAAGVEDFKSMYRVENREFISNVTFPYMKTKKALDHWLYQNPLEMKKELEKFGFTLVDRVVTSQTVDDRFEEERKNILDKIKTEREASIVKALDGICEPEFTEEYHAIRDLVDNFNYSPERILEDFSKKTKAEILISRIKYPCQHIEDSLFRKYTVGETYSMEECKSYHSIAVTKDIAKELHCRTNAYRKVLARYFDMKVSEKDKTITIKGRIELKRTEVGRDL